jgi:hypothetical protein
MILKRSAESMIRCTVIACPCTQMPREMIKFDRRPGRAFETCTKTTHNLLIFQDLKPSPDFSPEFGILDSAGKGGWTIDRRSIAAAMVQGESFKIRRQMNPKAK